MLFWGIGAAIVVTILVANFVLTGERTVETPIPRLYGAGDPQFLRSMGSLLGPALLPGNRTTELLNGDQRLASMSRVIRTSSPTSLVPLIFRPIVGKPPRLPLDVVWPEGNLSPTAKHVVEVALEVSGGR